MVMRLARRNALVKIGVIVARSVDDQSTKPIVLRDTQHRVHWHWEAMCDKAPDPLLVDYGQLFKLKGMCVVFEAAAKPEVLQTDPELISYIDITRAL